MAHRTSYTSSLADRAVLAGFAVSLCCVTIPAAPAVSGFLRRSAAFSIWVGGFGHGAWASLRPPTSKGGRAVVVYDCVSSGLGSVGCRCGEFRLAGQFWSRCAGQRRPRPTTVCPTRPLRRPSRRLLWSLGAPLLQSCLRSVSGVPPPCSGGPNALRRLPLPDHTPAAYVGVGPGPGGSLWAPGPKLRLVVPVTRCRFLGEIFGFAC